jgi:hypothetical protein
LLWWTEFNHNCFADLNTWCTVDKTIFHELKNDISMFNTKFWLQDRFTSENEWKSLLLMLHRKMQTLGDETLLKPFYMQVTKGRLFDTTCYWNLFIFKFFGNQRLNLWVFQCMEMI